MRIGPPLKALIVALPTGAWIVQRDASLGATLALAAGAALVTYAWIVLSPSPPAPPVPAAPAAPAAQRGCSVQRHDGGAPRISRRPTRRGARNVRCRASRARARGRRSARR
jgi:hypothetical protein